ncbi:hypothetical protein IZY60_09670 [Lutibacter sp. B2]|nr:hypothetical protein [Lutibacter sp. B2]
MPAISKIRFTNVIYEGGAKRYNDDIFQFDGHNGAILLENGGGKTVFIQTAIQAILPHSDLGERKIKETLSTEGEAAHIAIEWILNEKPRRYGLTAVTLFNTKRGLDSYKYVYEYEAGDPHSIENLPLVKETTNGKKRPVSKEEIHEYYQYMNQKNMNAHTFDRIKDYYEYIEDYFKIIPSEWRKIALINGAEGGVEKFFDGCKTTGQLVDHLLIPAVEEALAGNGTKDFVEMFEKQREHFKEHKQLRERIEESKLVQEQIKLYVDVFTELNSVEQTFMREKEEAKGIFQFAKKEQDTTDHQLQDNKNLQEECMLKEKEMNRKVASYKLGTLRKELEKSKKAYDVVNEEDRLLDEEYKSKNQRLQSLEIVKKQKEIKDIEDSIHIYEEQLKLLDMNEDELEIEEKLNRNTCELKGYFVEEEHKLNRQKNIIFSQKERSENDFKEKKSILNRMENSRTEILNKKTKIQTTIENIKNNMEEIAKKILSNPFNEKVEDELPNWKKKVEAIEKNNELYRKHIKQLSDEKVSTNEELPKLRKNFTDVMKKENDLKNNIDTILQNQSKLLMKLKECKPDWEYIDSLYLKQPTICTYTETQVEKSRKEKEELLINERLAHRFFDDYKDTSYFTADPLLEKWVDGWKNQFNFIETGTVYIQRAAKTLGKSEVDFYNVDPYWSIILITSENEVEKLMHKIMNQADKLTHPVFIISDMEARDIINNKDVTSKRKIFPLAWKENLNQDHFVEWKNHIAVVAKESKDKRQEKEMEYNHWNDLLQSIRDFFEMYPYEQYKELEEVEKKIKEEVQNLDNIIHLKEKRVNQLDGELSEYQTKLKNNEQENIMISTKIVQAVEYMNKKREKEIETSKKYVVMEEIEKVKDEIEKIKKEVENLEEIFEARKDECYYINNEINHLKRDVLYTEVNKAMPVNTSTSKNILMKQREAFKDQLNKKQKGRNELNTIIKIHSDNKDKLDIELKNKYSQIDFYMDEGLEFPLYGEEEIEKLIGETKKIKSKLDNLSVTFIKIEKEYNKKNDKYSIRESDFYEKFDKIMLFTKSLQEVKDEIENEKNELNTQVEYLNGREKKLEKEIKNINKAIYELEKKNEKYEFLRDEVKEITLSSEIKQEIPYKTEQVISEIIKRLDNLQQNVFKLKNKIQKQQTTFIGFCQENIYDVKLKEVAVLGIQYKKSYDDILEWQSKMNERISRTIKIAEDDMREHDKELQQYIDQLHSHLYTIAQELRTIPRKTRVKVEDQWKEIFLFTVPEWDEQEGKDDIRKYIDWIIKQLESQQFKDEQGNEKDVLMKKSIEKWLNTKQLLQNVMKRNTIKVKSRKVTNDGKVSGIPTPWEQSNLWSGGEKWSKNMTLFLGILNYLAEKRYHIPVNQKHNRTVIVDNPFGKASSDHVLDPVFFIAKQLGFQMIALTAHAEGKFIRSYFPIIYSCRLRSAANGENLILTKEKEIQYAFFKDHDPQTLVRLGEQEQLTLF